MKRILPPIDRTQPFGSRRPGGLANLAWRLATARLPAEWRRRVRKRLACRFPGPFDVSLGGLKLRLYPAENRCDRTILGRHALPEVPERALIRPLLRDGMVFVDVGANVGVYSLHISSATKGTARVVALEPHPRTFAKLDYNCAINGFDRVSRINAGAGEAEGEMTLFSDGGGNIGNASLLEAVGGGKERQTVRLRPLVSILAEQGIDRIDLLKIDVEGFEDRALIPFFEAANRALWPRHILVETVHAALWRGDLMRYLKDRGYGDAGRTDENRLLALRASAPVQASSVALNGRSAHPDTTPS
ncbi:MAG: FkbM family methyltransferase [Pararhizobium sp.]